MGYADAQRLSPRWRSRSALMGRQEYRHNDLLDPQWNMLDVMPEGRGDLEPRLSYA